jgi:hypothetical protein
MVASRQSSSLMHGEQLAPSAVLGTLSAPMASNLVLLKMDRLRIPKSSIGGNQMMNALTMIRIAVEALVDLVMAAIRCSKNLNPVLLDRANSLDMCERGAVDHVPDANKPRRGRLCG